MKEPKSRGLRSLVPKLPQQGDAALIKNSGSSVFSGDYDYTLDYPIPSYVENI